MKSPFVRTEEQRSAAPSPPSAIRCAPPCSMAEGDTSRFVRATSCLTNTIGGFLRERGTDELTVRSRVNKGAFTCEQASGRLFNRCLMARSFAPRQRFKRWVHLHLKVGKILSIQ